MSPFRASAGFTDRWEHFGFEVAGGVATVIARDSMTVEVSIGEVVERKGMYLRVRTPTGIDGWVHRTTLDEVH